MVDCLAELVNSSPMKSISVTNIFNSPSDYRFDGGPPPGFTESSITITRIRSTDCVRRNQKLVTCLTNNDEGLKRLTQTRRLFERTVNIFSLRCVASVSTIFELILCHRFQS